ncbi:unnamed protein product [Caenorhabditis angaria]|uniref:Uncharacterized protein n=1 Tax=Caenorhabditis angaria TaxID=860376 RepID=A0A9P1N3R4_9PELO|nr:unnamed protein product [Caenorhabditis angaria]
MKPEIISTFTVQTWDHIAFVRVINGHPVYGVAVVVLIAGAVAFYCYRKKKAAKNLGNNAHGKKTMSTSNSNDKLSAKSPTAKPSPNGWLAKNPFV